MSKETKQSKAVLIIACMYKTHECYKKSLLLLRNEFGKESHISEEFDFSYSNYYSKEMGDNLKKKIIVFDKMIARDYLVKVKKITDKIEINLSENDRRNINLDPAILTLENFILATNKNFTHRIFLSENVFADLTLIYKKSEGYTSLPWTYSDYSSEHIKNFLNDTRKIFYDRLLADSPFGK